MNEDGWPPEGHQLITVNRGLSYIGAPELSVASALNKISGQREMPSGSPLHRDKVDQEFIMNGLKAAAFLAGSLMLSGCEGGTSAYSEQDTYGTPGYYGTPTYAPPGYGSQSGYSVPYGYQPGYSAPYAYGPGWQGQDYGREHERRGPEMGAQPRGPALAAPVTSQPPPVARSQADQNRQFIDQLGFRPSR